MKRGTSNPAPENILSFPTLTKRTLASVSTAAKTVPAEERLIAAAFAVVLAWLESETARMRAE